MTLNGPAPTGGLIVRLASSAPAVANVPNFVVVPAGQTSATFPMNVLAGPAGQMATLTAAFGSSSTQAPFQTAGPPSTS